MTNAFHYYLTASKLIYLKNNIRESVEFNTLIRNDLKQFNFNNIAQTQTAVQSRFFQEVEPPSPDVTIKDIFVIAVSYLGYMTDNEFNKGHPTLGVDKDVPETTVQSPVEAPVDPILDPEPDYIHNDPQDIYPFKNVE